MPQQETIFDQRTDAKRVQVLKVYDSAYARDCFNEMDEDARAFLSKSLDLSSKYDIGEQGSEVAWEDIEDEAREDGNLLTFFVVLEERNGRSKPLYVSPDWPSSEQFAKTRI